MTSTVRPRFSIVIVTLNGEKRLPKGLAALRASLGKWEERCEIFVVDNGSHDGSSEIVRQHSWVRLFRMKRNLGFAGGNNVAIRRSRGEIVVLLNDDAYPEPGWLDRIDETARANPGWGAIGCLLLYPDTRKVQHAGGVIGVNALTQHLGWGEEAPEWMHRDCFEVDYVSGAAMAINREALRIVGLLDAGYFPAYFEESDLCVRMRGAGFKVLMEPRAIVLHEESQVLGAHSRRFLTMYHTNRLRFVLVTRTRSELVRTLRAEARWIWRDMPRAQIVPMLVAWSRAALRLPSIRAARKRHFRTLRKARQLNRVPDNA